MNTKQGLVCKSTRHYVDLVQLLRVQREGPELDRIYKLSIV